MKDFIINSSLISEWNWKKNIQLGLDPNKLTFGSNKKAWWKCKTCGHEWLAKIENRVILGRGCPECAKGKQTSTPEIKLYYYIKKYFPDAISWYENKELGISELDIYIPSLCVGIEYDGGLWHTDIEKDKTKDISCEINNISLVRIREPKCPTYESNCFFVHLEDRSQKTLVNAILYILYTLGVDNPEVDFNQDLSEIESLVCYQTKDNSLEQLFPEIAAEWHPTKNGTLKPDSVLAHSGKRVWWKCGVCGYEWITDICSRANGTCCPECKKEKIRLAQSEAVYCPELDRIFKSGCEAARQTGIPQSSISMCCTGKAKSAGTHPTTGEKLTWRKLILTVQN